MGPWDQSVAPRPRWGLRPEVLGQPPERTFERMDRVTAKGALHAFESRSVKAGFLRDRLCEEAALLHADAIVDVTVGVEGLLWRRRLAVRGVAIRYLDVQDSER